MSPHAASEAPLFAVLSCLPSRHDALKARWPQLDVVRLTHSAARHGVSALVADFLAACGIAVPMQLRDDARAAIARGLRMRALTVRVLEALAREGVTPVLLKGSGLAERLYPEQPLARPATDVDVWVTPDELPRAGRALERLGLASQRDEGHADVMHEHHHLSWSAKGALVEVHFKLFSGFGGGAFDDAALRARLRDGEFGGQPVRWLHPADEFVYLAEHAAQHGFLRASWLVDLMRALAAPAAAQFDWWQLRAACEEAGVHEAVAAALYVLEHSLLVTLPVAARRAFAVSPWRAAGHALLFSPARLEAAEVATHRVGRAVERLWLLDSPRAVVTELSSGAARVVRRLR